MKIGQYFNKAIEQLKSFYGLSKLKSAPIPTFEDYETRVMSKYYNWADLSKEDEFIVDRLSLIGLFSHNYDFSHMKPRVKLTDLAKKLLE